MNHIERFYATIERKPVDRPASWLGLPDSTAYPQLFKYFGVNNVQGLKQRLDDDIYPIEFPYHSPTANAIYAAFNFAQNHKGSEHDRTLTEAGFFQDYSQPEKVDDFDWPDPTKYIDPKACLRAVEEAPSDVALMGMMWSAHFQDTCAAFGMESALIKMLLEPEMYEAVCERIVAFYLKANEIFYEATRGKLHAVLIGNDLGSQLGLMLSPELIRQFVLPGTKKLVEQAKGYGLKVIHHSCGAIFDIIPDLIDVGVDAIHPIQALAKGMEARGLQKAFGDKVSFCGGVDVQQLLVHGTPKEIKAKVYELRELFKTGLIISPSHEAILPDIPPCNIEALFEAVHN